MIHVYTNTRHKWERGHEIESFLQRKFETKRIGLIKFYDTMAYAVVWWETEPGYGRFDTVVGLGPDPRVFRREHIKAIDYILFGPRVNFKQRMRAQEMEIGNRVAELDMTEQDVLKHLERKKGSQIARVLR